MDITTLLFNDVSKSSMVSNRWQEKWLAIQLRANFWINEICKTNNLSCDSTKPTAIFLHKAYDILIENLENIDRFVIENNEKISSPPLGNLITEIIVARKNVLKIHHSRLKNYLRKISVIEEEEKRYRVENYLFNLVEILCLFPNSLLNYIFNFEQEYEKLPTSDDIVDWLSSKAFDKSDIKYLRTYITKSHEALIIGYLRYALRISRNYVENGIEYLDLVQSGFVGLIKAAKRYCFASDGNGKTGC